MKCEVSTVIDRPWLPSGTMEVTTQGRTELTIDGEFPGLDDSMEATIRPLMERSAATIRSLIESET